MTTHPIPQPTWLHGLTHDVTIEPDETGFAASQDRTRIRYWHKASTIPNEVAGDLVVGITSTARTVIADDPIRAGIEHDEPRIVIGPPSGTARSGLATDIATAEQLGWSLLRAVEVATRRTPFDPNATDTGAREIARLEAVIGVIANHVKPHVGPAFREIERMCRDALGEDYSAFKTGGGTLTLHAECPGCESTNPDRRFVVECRHPWHDRPVTAEPKIHTTDPRQEGKRAAVERYAEALAAASPVTASECARCYGTGVTIDHQPCDHPTPIDTGALSRMAARQVVEDTAAAERLENLPDQTLTLSGTYDDAADIEITGTIDRIARTVADEHTADTDQQAGE